MKVSEIKNSTESLPGIGKATASLLAKLNIFTVGALLTYYPRKYEDQTRKITLAQSLSPDSGKAHTIAIVTGHEWFGYGRMRTLKILINDGSAEAELIAFNRGFLENVLPVNSIIAVTGKFEMKYGALQASQFEATKLASSGRFSDFVNRPVPDSKVFAIYGLTEGLSQKMLRKAIDYALKQFSLGIEDEIPPELIKKYGLLRKKDALKMIHQPESLADAKKAKDTLIYEELYNFQKQICLRALEHKGSLPDESEENKQKISEADAKIADEKLNADFTNSLSPRQKKLIESLPFDPTRDQKKVILKMNDEIDKSYGAANTQKSEDCADSAGNSPQESCSSPLSSESFALSQSRSSAYAMRVLLQGDVGSGKTLVSFFAALRVCDYGSQCAFMAPTEILSRQHAENAAKLLSPLDVKIAYLTANINAKGRSVLLSELKAGRIDIVIGTHALFSKSTQYFDLAFVIIDEQHRFGVTQRASIVEKGRNSLRAKIAQPNLLMMSATPIPQTLALTVFGDLDVLTIKTMPVGRKPVKTYLVRAGNEKNAYEAVRSELRKGHQAYFVYPAIGTDENDEIEDEYDEREREKRKLKAAEEMFAFLKNEVYPEFTAALVHGKIEESGQSKALNGFSSGEIKILVATTVVEVGVDVPNATCMVIEQADRFGLAALHQLRGRVGRGSAQSFCFLIYSKNLTETGVERMKILHETTDGFKIAEEDLKLRGPGEITGTAQSGELTFSVADVSRDQKILQIAREDVLSELKAASCSSETRR